MSNTLLFIHTHKFKLINGEYYTTGGLSDIVLRRYTRLADKVLVAARVENLPDSNASKFAKITIKNVEIVNIGGYYMSMFSRIINVIRQCDYVIIRLPSIYGIIAAIYCMIHKKPFLVEVVGCIWDTLWNYSIAGKILAGPFWIIHRLIIFNSPYVSYITKSFLQERYPTRGVRGDEVSNITLNVVEAEVLQMRQFKILNSSMDEKFKIGLIGDLNVLYKGHRTAIKALYLLVREFPQIELQLVGSGDKSQLFTYCRTLKLDKNVVFLGPIPNQDVSKWIDSLDLYIQPSSAEAHGRAVIEAMARSCPVCSSNIGGLKESVLDKYRFKPRDYSHLAKMIKKLIINKNYLIESSEHSFQTAHQYLVQTVEKRRQDLIEKFLTHNNILLVETV